MDFLKNNWPTILSSSIAIISIGVTIWLAFRRPVQLSIFYEALVTETLDDSEELKTTIEQMNLSPGDGIIGYPCFITFKISNPGKVPVTLSESSKPLIIAFLKGYKILDWKLVEAIREDVEFTCKAVEHKLLLTLPFLDSNESITLRVLVSHYVNYSPDIYVRDPRTKRIVRANNVRSSKQWRIVGVTYICAAAILYIYFSFEPFGNNPLAAFYFISKTVAFLLIGILCFLTSWIDRRLGPYQSELPLTNLYRMLKMFVRAIPGLIIAGILAAAIYVAFGSRVLAVVFLMFSCLLGTLAWWIMPYITVTNWLQKKKRAYNPIKICSLTSIPSIVLLTMSVWLFVYIFQHW